MDIIVLLLSYTAILTIMTKIGFIVQRTYYDIRGIALSSFLATVTAFVTVGLPFIGFLAAYIMFLYLLCKIGRISLIPDAILASIIGSGGLIVLLVEHIKDVGITTLFF